MILSFLDPIEVMRLVASCRQVQSIGQMTSPRLRAVLATFVDEWGEIRDMQRLLDKDRRLGRTMNLRDMLFDISEMLFSCCRCWNSSAERSRTLVFGVNIQMYKTRYVYWIPGAGIIWKEDWCDSICERLTRRRELYDLR